MMTPLEVEILLAIRCGTFRRNNIPSHTSPAAETILVFLRNKGLITLQRDLSDPDPSEYVLTDAGRKLTDKILEADRVSEDDCRKHLDRIRSLVPSGPGTTYHLVCAELNSLRAELAKAKRCLERHGFVDNGGTEWKPPIVPGASRLLDQIERMRIDQGLMVQELKELREQNASLRAEMQRLEGERGQFGPCSDGWTYSIGSIAWGKTIESPSRVSLSRKHADGRREELFDFVPKNEAAPVVKMGGITAKAGDEIVGSVEFRGDYDPPADVLGEAFRRSVLLAKPGTGLLLGDRDGCLIGESVDAAKFRHLHSAVSGLAQVVERIARQQGGGK